MGPNLGKPGTTFGRQHPYQAAYQLQGPGTPFPGLYPTQIGCLQASHQAPQEGRPGRPTAAGLERELSAHGHPPSTEGDPAGRGTALAHRLCSYLYGRVFQVPSAHQTPGTV